MIPRVRLEVAIITLAAIISTCADGLKIDFSKLAALNAPYYSLPLKRDKDCPNNPCDTHKPFPCNTKGQCIRIKQVCDGHQDCDDGFDEDASMCNAGARFPVEVLMEYLQQERKWIMPLLFNGANVELTAHALSVASDMNDLRATLGLTDQNVYNLHRFFEGVIEGDPRALVKMGMPERAFNELSSVFQNIYDSGFKP